MDRSTRKLAQAPMYLALALGAACAGPETPDVTRSTSLDEKGRKVVSYLICEERGLFPVGERVCRIETAVQNFCYPTLASVSCYDLPVPGRNDVSSPE